MTRKPLKSIRTLASESKARRKTPLTPEQVEKEQEQERTQEDFKRKIAGQG